MEGFAEAPDYWPQVKFDFDQDPDPVRRRRKNIRRAKKRLKPVRTWWSFGPLSIARFNDDAQCCVTGIRLSALGPAAFDKPLLDPDTLQPLDDGRTLASHFFVDQLSGGSVRWTAMSSVDTGYPLRSSYCPELLQLYYLYTQWKQQEQLDKQGQMSLWLWKRRRIKMVPITEKPKQSKKPALVDAIEPFFQLCLDNRGRGVEISEYKNALANEVDLVTITLDLRMMRHLEAQASEASSVGAPSE
jgi:hypothetical protein